jgi:cation/acetate symporter
MISSKLWLLAESPVTDSSLPWTYTFVTITFMIYLFIGWRSRVKETQGFYVAGQGVPAIANGAATAADWMSAASFISMAGLICFAGSDGSMYLIGWTGGYVLLALLLAPYLRKFGQYTVPDFVAARYDSDTARVVAAVCAIFVSLTYVAGQMNGVGIVFSRFLAVDLTVGVIIGMFIVAFFAVLGGMKGITWTQVAQYFVLVTAFLVPTIALSWTLADNPLPQLAFVISDLATELNMSHQQLGFEPYTQPFTGGRSMLDVLCITAALMFGTAGLPHVIVRFYTVPNVRAARWSAFWALLFIAILYTAAPVLAMFARTNLIQSLHNADVKQIDILTTDTDGKAKIEPLKIQGATEAEQKSAYARATQTLTNPKELAVYLLTNKKDGETIDWAYKWQITRLLTFTDNNGDGRISMNAVKDKDGKLVHEDGVINKDIIVVSAAEVAGLPDWVIALVAAGALAAALSTAAGLLLVISSSIAHDLYIHYVDPEASEAKRVMVGRIMIILAIGAAGYFGINPPGFVGEVVAFAFGLAAASFFPAIFLGIFDKRTNRQGAITGMVVGILFTGIYILGITAVKVFPAFFSEPWFGRWCFGISPQGIGTIGMLLNFVVTIVISRLTPPPSQEVQDLVESVRIPKMIKPENYEI